jgi:hypothetical protein
MPARYTHFKMASSNPRTQILTDWVGLLAILAVLTVLVIVYDCTQFVSWVGGYPVNVKIERLSSRPVSRVSYAVLFRREWTDCEGDLARIDSGWHEIDASSGDTFTLNIKSLGETSGLGRRIRYNRQEVLVLTVAYTNGGSDHLTVELPDSRSSGELVVRVP